MAVVVPTRVVQEKGLRENDEILIEVVKEADLSSVFGSLKSKGKLSGQAFKNLVRKGWE
jgi:hypothetical protein